MWPLTLQWVDGATFRVSPSQRQPDYNQEAPMNNNTSGSGLQAVPGVVRRYFALDAEREIDSIIALFSDDATVVDEGEARRGTDAIRAWQTGPASQYTYTTDVLGTHALTANRFVVTGRLTGNFPGGTAELKWDFTVTGDRISHLIIAP
jgi:SnoaL-like domain